jgi:hypothetical protein
MSWETKRLRHALTGAGAVLLLALAPGHASAANYTVGNCVSDPTTYTADAFAVFATRGMKIRKACSPRGDGVRALVVGNVVRRGSIKRGAKAELVLNAPAGTHFVEYRWSGRPVRADCRYAMQMWGEAPGAAPIPILNVRANQKCPKKGRAQTAQFPEKPYPMAGATRIVQRVTCVGGGGRNACSSAGENEIRTFRAEMTLEDVVAPTATTLVDTPLTRGEWVTGDQVLNYDANDNVGVQSAEVIIGGAPAGNADRPCRFANSRVTFAIQTPCPNGPGQMIVTTARVSEGTQPLVLRVKDPAANLGDSQAITARIDRTPPDRVEVTVEGGQDWRSRNDFAVAWTNPAELDRAPIVAANYRLCPAGGGACQPGQQTGPDLSRFAMPVPTPGEWTVSLTRRDAAGNESEQTASVPVTLRYDPEPPQLAFEPPVPSDPTLVAVKVSDPVSGVANGSIEISSTGSGVWQTLAVQREGDRLLARVDDAALPAGPYELRARASDQARNEASTNLRLDGQPMTLALPLRVVSTLQSVFERQRTVRQQVRRGGRTRVVRRRVVVQTQTARVLFGESAQVAGRLVAPDGTGIAGADVQILATTPIGAEQAIGVVQTDAEGGYRYVVAGTSNQALRVVYAGSSTVLASAAELSMTVPAATELRVNRRRLRNGQAVTFGGPVRTLPAPPGGKLVEMQVRLPGRWETFRTIRSDDAGQWSVRYRFRRTGGVQHYRFRARLPAEGAYPFTAGVSRVVTVRVRGA